MAYQVFSGHLTLNCVIFVSLKTIQLSILFVYTQLVVKTVLFQRFQFSISTQSSSIWLIDKTLPSANTQARVDLDAIAMNGYSVFPKALVLLNPYYPIV